MRGPTQPDPTQPDPMKLLRSLYIWNGSTDSRAVFFVRCHHSINFVFDLHQYPSVFATARGTCRARGCRRHPTLDNFMTAGPIGGTSPPNYILRGTHPPSTDFDAYGLLRAEREARSGFFCGLREKSQYARPDPTRPDPTRPHDAFEKLISLERVDRFTSCLLCSMSPFNKFRI